MNKALATLDYSNEQLTLIRKTLAPTNPPLDDNEFALFIEVSKRLELDIIRKEMYVQKRRIRGRNGAPDEYRLVFITSIDGYRKRAANSGLYEGQLGPQWCGQDGVWRDVWLDAKPPAAARIGVLRKGCREPFWGVARYDAYVQTEPDWRDGKIVGHKPVEMWRKMADNQLAKCAEALATRKAFPNELGDVRTKDEMAQADTAGDPTPSSPDAPPPENAWDKVCYALSLRIKAAKKGGEMNLIAADLEKAKKDGIPEALYAALRDLFDARAAKAKGRAKQDYEPSEEEVAQLGRDAEVDDVPFS